MIVNLKIVFHQDNIRLSGKVTGVAIKNVKPVAPETIPQIEKFIAANAE